MDFSEELNHVLYEGGNYIGSEFFYSIPNGGDFLKVTSYDDEGNVDKVRTFLLVEAE